LVLPFYLSLFGSGCGVSKGAISSKSPEINLWNRRENASNFGKAFSFAKEKSSLQ
jgi:hypothetical protein